MHILAFSRIRTRPATPGAVDRSALEGGDEDEDDEEAHVEADDGEGGYAEGLLGEDAEVEE